MNYLALKVIPSFLFSFFLHFLAFLSLILFSPILYRTGDYATFLETRLYQSKDISVKIPVKKKNVLNKRELTIKSKKILWGKEKEIDIKKKIPSSEDIKNKFIIKETDSNESKEDSIELLKTLSSQEEVNEPKAVTPKKEEPALETQTQELTQKENIKSEDETIKTTRLQESDNPMQDIAIDSLFDRDGSMDKEMDGEKQNETPSEIHNIEVIKGLEKKIIKRYSKKTITNSAKKYPPKKIQKSSAIEKTIEKKNPSKEVVIQTEPLISSDISDAETSQAYSTKTNLESIVEEIKQLNEPKEAESQKVNGTRDDTIAKDLKEDHPIIIEPKAVLPPEPIGDLKVEIRIENGSEKDMKAQLIFKELPVKKRNRPLKRSDIRHEKIEPLIIERKDTIVFILEKTKEGVYELIVEPLNPITIYTNLKVREKRPDEKIKNLGIIKINKKTSIFKILMPEGILWDDDSYFDGYMEDIESITKFNNRDGLIWKEYKEEK